MYCICVTKDLFDINNHLKKKNIEKNSKPDLFLLKTQTFNRANTLILSHTYTLANGDKVYTSPLCNMPVVKPDMTLFNTMPTIGHGQQITLLALNRFNPGSIPNGSAPLVLQK